MHSMPYLIKNSAGVWCVQRKVPENLQAAVARVLGGKKAAQVYLKKSLGTKDRREATRRATHALADLDRTLREAKALIAKPAPKTPLRTTLSETEIKRMAEYVYAKTLAWDERVRFGGRDEVKRMEAEHQRLTGEAVEPWAIPYEQWPRGGLPPTVLHENHEALLDTIRFVREAAALGDFSVAEEHIADALDAFNIQLDEKCPAYTKLGTECLRAYLRALEAIAKRDDGEPIETPKFVLPSSTASASETLRDALEGWKKERERPPLGVHE
jgi:hypothetical protein